MHHLAIDSYSMQALLDFIPCDCRIRTVVDRSHTNGIVTWVGCQMDWNQNFRLNEAIETKPKRALINEFTRQNSYYLAELLDKGGD